MSNLLTILALGFFLGVRHAADPDHVVAVSTLVTRQHRPWDAALTGLWWGLGHSLTIIAVGTAIIAFSITIPPQVGVSMEMAVAAMLVLLGLVSLRSLRRAPPALVVAEGGETVVRSTDRGVGAVAQVGGPLAARGPGGGPDGRARPFIVGIVHGLAGSAAIALTILALITDRSQAFFYLLLYGAGTIAGMLMLTAAVAVPLTWAGQRSAALQRGVGVLAGAVSVCLGVVMIARVV
ncbi:MAG: HoxN/HupN/NixA family nickel/cobalt transporter [Gemmatimonadota bacterium]